MQDQAIAAQFFAMFLEARDGVPRDVPGIEYADLTVTREHARSMPRYNGPYGLEALDRYYGYNFDEVITQEIPVQALRQAARLAVAS